MAEWRDTTEDDRAWCERRARQYERPADGPGTRHLWRWDAQARQLVRVAEADQADTPPVTTGQRLRGAQAESAVMQPITEDGAPPDGSL